MKIYSIKNEHINFFNRPIYVESENEAISYIQNVLMSDADRALLHLKDSLSLYYLGDIDFVSGVITPFEPILVTPLAYIFDTIPTDKIPRTENALRAEIDNLRSDYKDLASGIENLVKEFNAHVDKKKR